MTDTIGVRSSVHDDLHTVNNSDTTEAIKKVNFIEILSYQFNFSTVSMLLMFV